MIVIEPGTYNENVDVNKSVDLIGNSTGQVEIHANNTGDYVLNITKPCLVKNVYVKSDNVTIKSVTSSNNRYGIYIESSTNISVNDSLVRKNDEYGIYATSSANITLANNEIKDNSKIDKSKSDDFKYKKILCGLYRRYRQCSDYK